MQSTCSQSEFGPLCEVGIRMVRIARVILTPNIVYICRQIRFGVLRAIFVPKNEYLHELQDSNMFMVLFKPWNQENLEKIIYKRFKGKEFYRFTQHIYNLRLLYHNAYWYLYMIGITQSNNAFPLVVGNFVWIPGVRYKWVTENQEFYP
jgi:hypothetical protein